MMHAQLNLSLSDFVQKFLMGSMLSQTLRFLEAQCLSRIQTIQGSFGQLRVPSDINSGSNRLCLLEVCCRLFNVRSNCVGVSQIRSVYLPMWRESEDAKLWDELGDMMFGEICRKDRVARFHVIPVE